MALESQEKSTMLFTKWRAPLFFRCPQQKFHPAEAGRGDKEAGRGDGVIEEKKNSPRIPRAALVRPTGFEPAAFRVGELWQTDLNGVTVLLLDEVYKL